MPHFFPRSSYFGVWAGREGILGDGRIVLATVRHYGARIGNPREVPGDDNGRMLLSKMLMYPYGHVFQKDECRIMAGVRCTWNEERPTVTWPVELRMPVKAGAKFATYMERWHNARIARNFGLSGALSSTPLVLIEWGADMRLEFYDNECGPSLAWDVLWTWERRIRDVAEATNAR